MEDIKKELQSIKSDALSAISNADSAKELGDVRIEFLSKQGRLTQILRGMRDVPAEQRPEVGAIVNDVRQAIEDAIKTKDELFAQAEIDKKIQSEKVDITEPSKLMPRGSLSPVSKVFDKLIEACVDMGFEEVSGPEIEKDYYNFEALNIPKNHPARDMQDSLYITDNILLRTHTSPVQARVMEKRKPPFKIIVPGATYRNDNDSTHSPIFHQMEGLVIDKNVSMADLKAILTTLLKRVFGQNSVTRFRPSFFPFTEPSIEVDVSCPSCNGKGCRLCKGTGFLEVLGAGVVNPKVLEMSGIDSSVYQGIAFGTGIERPAMILNSIGDMKTLFKNDLKYLKQLR